MSSTYHLFRALLAFLSAASDTSQTETPHVSVLSSGALLVACSSVKTVYRTEVSDKLLIVSHERQEN